MGHGRGVLRLYGVVRLAPFHLDLLVGRPDAQDDVHQSDIVGDDFRPQMGAPKEIDPVVEDDVLVVVLADAQVLVQRRR